MIGAGRCLEAPLDGDAVACVGRPCRPDGEQQGDQAGEHGAQFGERGAVAEGEIAGALYPSEAVGGEQAMGGIGGPHGLKLCLGGTKGGLTIPAVTEHGVALTDVQERKALQGMAAGVHAALGEALGQDGLEALADGGRYQRDVY